MHRLLRPLRPSEIDSNAVVLAGKLDPLPPGVTSICSAPTCWQAVDASIPNTLEHVDTWACTQVPRWRFG